MPATESAVLVLVPAAEPAVGEFRARLDRAAGWGVPAHVTVIYPFLPPDRIGPAELRRLREAVRTVPAFEVSFAEVRWFDDAVVWLAPTPTAGFQALTSAVWTAFPQCPPYRGEHDGSVPHLTIGHDAGRDVLAAAGAAVTARLPVTTAIGAAHLLQGWEAPGAWRTVAELPLG